MTDVLPEIESGCTMSAALFYNQVDQRIKPLFQIKHTFLVNLARDLQKIIFDADKGEKQYQTACSRFHEPEEEVNNLLEELSPDQKTALEDFINLSIAYLTLLGKEKGFSLPSHPEVLAAQTSEKVANTSST